MLLEIIFKGLFPILNLSFLSNLLVNVKDVRFNNSEISNPENLEEILKIFHDNEYADLVISTDEFHVEEKIVPKVFINLTKDEEYFEMLIFFDLNDFNKNIIDGVDELMGWSSSFQKKYNFNYYVCQIDNANDKEYYFNNNGLGPLYDKLGG